MKNFESTSQTPNSRAFAPLSWMKCTAFRSGEVTFGRHIATSQSFGPFSLPIFPFLALLPLSHHPHYRRFACLYSSTPRLHFSSISVTTAPISHLRFTNLIPQATSMPYDPTSHEDPTLLHLMTLSKVLSSQTW